MTARHIAVIGAGWGGMTAAVQAALAGHRVTVFEASRAPGGRARSVEVSLPTGETALLDNGQHILIGAYSECLRLMRTVGVNPDAALLRLPLALVFPDGTGLALPNAPPPWDALTGIARAHGWSLGERVALLARAARWRRAGFRCTPSATVAHLCAGLPARLLREFIDPLCVSALNTPAASACGQTFLRVLQDGLFSGRGGSNLLLPRTDLGALLPVPATAWLRARGHAVHTGCRVQKLAWRSPQSPYAPPQMSSGSAPRTSRWFVNDAPFDAVILATGSAEAARLVASTDLPAACAWAATATALHFGAIATVYVLLANTAHIAAHKVLPRPMLTLRSGPGNPAQFVFDRGQLGGPPGLLAFVVSAFKGERQTLEAQVLAQAAHSLHPCLPPNINPHCLHIVQTVVEKRATFVCTPQLTRPPMHIAPGLLACGDYVAGPYPATLEGAVLHGAAAARECVCI